MGKVQLSKGRVVGGQNAQDLSPAKIRDINYRNVYERFGSRFMTGGGAGGATAPTGTAGDENVLLTDNAAFEWHVIGTQTILTPTFNATLGVDLVQDEITGDGSELTLGINATSRGAFTVGANAFHLKLSLNLEDVSGFPECAVGFRKVEAYTATLDNYNDMAAFNIQAGVINIETILANAGTTTTDTTLTDWVDDASHTLEISVGLDGVCSFYYDDAVPTIYPGDGTVAAFTLDADEVMMPFVHQKLDASAANGCFVKDWQSGFGARAYA